MQRHQKWWIQNPSLLTCVKTIRNFAYVVCWIVFTRVRLVLIFQSTIFEVIGLPQSGMETRGLDLRSLIYYKNSTWSAHAYCENKRANARGVSTYFWTNISKIFYSKIPTSSRHLLVEKKLS